MPNNSAGLASLFSAYGGSGDPRLDAALGLSPQTREDYLAEVEAQLAAEEAAYSGQQSQAQQPGGWVTAPPKGEGGKNLQTAYQYFIQQGLPHHVAAGIVGNLAQESGGVAGGGLNKEGGMGIAQWRGERLHGGGAYAGLIPFAKQRGASPEDLRTQLDHIMYELQGPERKAFDALMNTRNAEEAAVAFSKYYERPNQQAANNQNRIAQAQRFMGAPAPQGEAPAASQAQPQPNLKTFYLDTGEAIGVPPDMGHEEAAKKLKEQGVKGTLLRDFQTPGGLVGVPWDMSDADARAKLEKEKPEMLVQPGMPLPDKSSMTAAGKQALISSLGQMATAGGAGAYRLGEALDSETIKGLGASAEKWGREKEKAAEGMFTPPTEQQAGTLYRKVGIPLAQGVGGMLPIIPTFMLNPAAGAAAVGLQTAGAMKERAEAEGKGETWADLAPYAAGATAVNLLPFKAIAPLFKAASSEAAIGSQAAIKKIIEEKGVEAARQEVGSEIGNIAKSMGLTMASGATADVANSVLERASIGKSLWDENAWDEYKEVLAQGAPTYGILGAGAGHIGRGIKTEAVERAAEQEKVAGLVAEKQNEAFKDYGAKALKSLEKVPEEKRTPEQVAGIEHLRSIQDNPQELQNFYNEQQIAMREGKESAIAARPEDLRDLPAQEAEAIMQMEAAKAAKAEEPPAPTPEVSNPGEILGLKPQAGLYKKLKGFDVNNVEDHPKIEAVLESAYNIPHETLPNLQAAMEAAKLKQETPDAIGIQEPTEIDVSGSAQPEIRQEGEGAPISGEGVHEGGPEARPIEEEIGGPTIRKIEVPEEKEFVFPPEAKSYTDRARVYKEATGEDLVPRVIDSTYSLIHDTDSGIRNFWDWYKDSKLTSKEGLPIRLYRGDTTPGIREFKASSDGLLGPGIYLTENPEHAKAYGEHITEVYADMKNPLVLHNVDDPVMAIATDPKFAEENFWNKGGARKWARDQMEDWAGIGDEDFPQMLRDAGYDGVVLYKDGKIQEAVVPNTHRIKSAKESSGRFSRYEPDIYAVETGAKSTSPTLSVESFGDVTNGKDLLERYTKVATDKQLAALANEYLKSPYIQDVQVKMHTRGDRAPDKVFDVLKKPSTGALTAIDAEGVTAYFRKDRPQNFTEETVVHEMTHALIEAAAKRNPKAAGALEEIGSRISTVLRAHNPKLADFWDKVVEESPTEVLTYGLTRPTVRDILLNYDDNGNRLVRNVGEPPVPPARTAWGKVFAAIRKFFGLSDKQAKDYETALNEYLNRQKEAKAQTPMTKRLDSMLNSLLKDSEKHGITHEDAGIVEARDVIRGLTSWTKDRIERLLDAYGYIDGRARAYAAWVDPQRFIDATTPRSEIPSLEQENRPLDREQLAKQTQPLFLEIMQSDTGGWKIVGHEGRHRMMALRDSGVTRAPVVLVLRQGEHLSPMSGMALEAQRYGERLKGGEDLHAYKLIPITYAFNDALVKEFHTNPRDVPSSYVDISFIKTPEEELKASGLAAEPAAKSVKDKMDQAYRDAVKEGRMTSLGTEYIDAHAGLREALSQVPTTVDKTLRGDLLYSALAQRGNVIQNSYNDGYIVLNSDGTIGVAPDANLAIANIYKKIDAYKGDKDPRKLFNNMMVGLRGKTIRELDAKDFAQGMDWMSKAEAMREYAATVSGKEASKFINAAVNLEKFAKEKLDKVRWSDGPTYEGRTHVTPEQAKLAEDILNKHPELKQQAMNIYALMGKQVDLWVDSGLLTAEQGDKFKKYGYYIPFYKSDEFEKQIADPSKYIEEIASRMGWGPKTSPKIHAQERHEHEIYVEDNLLKHISFMASAAAENSARRNTLEQMELFGKAKPVKGTSKDDPQVIKFMKDGEARFYNVGDANAYFALMPAQPLMNPLLRLMRSGAAYMRTAMIVNPLFWIRQLIREPLQASMVAGTGAITPFDAMAALAKISAGTSESYKTLKQRGVVGPVDVISDPAKFVKVISGKKGLVSNGFESLKHIHEAVDSATRVVVYERAKADALAKGLDEATAEAMGAMKARELINFSKQGRSQMVRVLRATTPFFGAALNSMDVLARAAFPTKLGKLSKADAMEARRLFYSNAAMITAFTVAYTMAMSDDEDYLKTPDRANNFLIPTGNEDHPFIKFSVPYEAGFGIKVLPELLTLYNMGVISKTKAVTEAGKSFGELVVPPLSFFAMVKPFAETVANLDFHTMRPIEGGLDASGSAQYRDRRASDTSKAIIKKMADMGVPVDDLGFSPDKLEHLAKGYMAQYWQLGRIFTDPMLRKEGTGEAPEKDWQDLPLISGLTVKGTKDQAVNDFYNLKNKVDAVKADLSHAERGADAGMYERVVSDPKNKPYIEMDKSIQEITKAIGERRAALEAFDKSKATGPEKKETRKKLEEEINALSRTGVNLARQLGVEI